MRLPFRLPVALLLLALAGLAGCGELPRPFKPTGQKEAVDLRAITYDSTVVVLPPDGDMPADPEPIAEALRDALLAEGLLATTWQESDGGLQLSGHAEVRPIGGSRDLLTASWSIDGPRGRRAHYQQTRALPAGAWQSSNHQVLAEVATEVAQHLAPQLLGPAVEEALLPGFPGAHLAVLPVIGAPGDGDRALASALKVALDRAKLPVVETRGAQDLAIQGSVAVTPASAGKEQISIVWRLEDADGKELGKISQANAIPAGSLNGEWGGIAVLVARGAASGLADLLDRLAREKAAG
ncbi:hypothetical protein SAMN06265365_11547 [Tistlia consotensis]|uniref:Lipoprotein n=1 Tax=Tistlia consotensis USBA 355 TaxID=560819 RepID=A0A1Y6CAZ6_9PROT|nr:hypothetical protein [Tistlia consotensis]SMF46338.1 hypothetical protein SAMN05428998_11687 [Tistlia consotensis USBA 355]SNR78602.1 hypothetical protein SAMN06265365_11547 [Tistlia consotensis]